MNFFRVPKTASRRERLNRKESNIICHPNFIYSQVSLNERSFFSVIFLTKTYVTENLFHFFMAFFRILFLEELLGKGLECLDRFLLLTMSDPSKILTYFNNRTISWECWNFFLIMRRVSKRIPSLNHWTMYRIIKRNL